MSSTGIWVKLSALRRRLYKSRQDKLEEELVRLSGKNVAQRLLELEQEKNPGASRQEQLESAIWRLKRDRK
ncbi:MAG: hypothetical protein ACOC43_08675 [Desulfohalobiaceae bacterium]